MQYGQTAICLVLVSCAPVMAQARTELKQSRLCRLGRRHET
jgi:hypothetical protein